MKKSKKKQFCIHGHDTFICGRTKGGRCIICYRIYKTDWRRQHGIRERRKFCPQGHDKDIVGRSKNGSCKICVKIWQKKSRQKMNKKKLKKYNKKYRKEHKQEIQRQQTGYVKNKRLINPIFKLSLYLRLRLNRAIRNNAKKGSAVRDLGCTVEFLKKYIEKKFYSNMSWDNWGKVWELDHKKALMFFDLTDRDQLLEAVNYKNLQLLTKLDHWEKSAKEKRKHLTKLAKV